MGYSFRISMVFLLLCVSTPYAWGGAWCQGRGALYSKVSYNRYFSVYTFDDGGHAKRNPNGSNFLDNNLTVYAEYGVLDDLTVFTSIPYKWLSSRVRVLDHGKEVRQTYRYVGVGDVDLGVKYCFVEKPLVLSGQFLTKLAWFYGGDLSVPPGNNQNDYELRLLAGKSLWPFPGYCGAEIGYRWRPGAPSDEYRYLLEFGVNLSKKFSSRIKLDGTRSVENADLGTWVDSSAGLNPSLGLEYDLGKLEFSLAYQQTENWFLELSYTSNPYGKAVAKADQYSLALVYYFSGK